MSVIQGSVIYGTTATLRARVTDADGTRLTQTDISSITCTVRDETAGTNITPNPSIVIASVVYDSYQAWPNNDPDTTGYNFAYDLSGATYLPTAGRFYFITFTFTLASGEVVYVEYELHAQPRQSMLAQDASLAIQFRQIQAAVANQMGWTKDYTDWSSTEVAEINDIVRSGLVQFYYPMSPGAEGTPYRWSFLSPDTTLSLVADDYDYDLPSDYAGNARDFTFGAGIGEKPLTPITEQQLRALKARDNAAGKPSYYALLPKTSDGTAAQGWEVLVYPTPEASGTLAYRYDRDPGMLTDAAPYPYGGTVHSKTILESCLACAEEWQKDESGVHRALFERALATSIQQDTGAVGPGVEDTWPIEDEPTDLDLTYPQLLRHIGQYLEYGWDDSRWTRDQRRVADEMLQIGLRQFYRPTAPEGVTMAGPWSFLQKNETLSLTQNATSVDFPTDFGGRIIGDLTYGDATAIESMVLIEDDRLRHLRSDRDVPGPPQYFSLLSRNQDGTGRQMWKASLYPTPDTVYAVTMRYISVPPRLTAENPYPLGGVEHAETILASCLAAAERRMKPGSSDRWSQYQTFLKVSIEADSTHGRIGETWPVGLDAPDTLELTYDTILMRVGQLWGFGWDPAVWSREERARADIAIHDGLRGFYDPAPEKGEKYGHRWSFLEPVATMTMVADTTAYELPKDFADIVGPFTFDPGSTVLFAPIEIVPEHVVRRRLAVNTSSSRPNLAAIRPKAKDGGGPTRYEVVFCPAPDDTYTLHYRYSVNMLPLGPDNQYPPGSQPHAQTILEGCLAAVELLKGKAGPHSAKYKERLAASISTDRQVASPDFVGYNRDNSDRPTSYPGNYHLLSDNVVSYNGIDY